MGYLSTRKDAKSLGKVCTEKKAGEKEEVSIEMKSTEVKESGKEIGIPADEISTGVNSNSNTSV